MQIYQEEFQRKTTFSLTFPFLSHLQTRNIGFSHLFFCIIQRHRKGIYFMRRNFEHRLTPSISNNLMYCLMMEFFGSVRMLRNAVRSSGFR